VQRKAEDVMPRKEIERFSVSYLQILDGEGQADPKLEPEIEEGELLRLYRVMMLAREQDQRMLKLQRQGRIGTFGPNTGQEAAHIGPAFAMGPDDWLVTSFREMGARLLRGEPLINALIFHNGFEEGNALPADVRRVTPISIIVGSQTLHATGIAYAMKYRGEKAAALVFFGDGASSQGDVYEAMNFAGVWQAPVVFVCQNNQWAISMPRRKQTRAATLAQKAIAAGIPGIQVDGNDVLATYVAAKEALERARAGEGPTLIEAVTYRLMMHTTADDPKKYRQSEEEEEAWGRDPLPRFRKYLERKGLWDDSRQQALAEEVKQEVDAAVKEFEARTDFKPDVLFDHVYGTRHAEIEAQRAQFLADLELKKKA
jgi:pyruvate dehydrogenase E1 component alpha subunit